MSDDSPSPPTPPTEDDAPGPPTLPPENEPSSPVQILPKSEVNFAFGPDHYYWARCGMRWRFVRSQSSEWARLGIFDAQWVAFKHDTGFIIGGEDDAGDACVVHSWNDGYMVRADEAEAFVKSREAYIKLHTWLTKNVASDPEKLKDVSLSIGPRGSYFARCRTSHITHALPKDLQTALQESDSAPLTIALGVKGAWVVLWADGTRSWDLRYAYPSLVSSGALNDSENRVVFVALNPSVEDQYFVGRERGECVYSVAFADKKQGEHLYDMTMEYIQMRAKRDRASFSFPINMNGAESTMRITPEGGVRTGGWDRVWRARRNMQRRDVLLCSAVASGTGVLARVMGLPAVRAVGLGISAGGGAAAAMWYAR